MQFFINRLSLREFDLENENIKLVTYRITDDSYIYKIYRKETNEHVGFCDLRVGHDTMLYYFGNIGYRIFPQFRGNNYAYQASLLLFKLAKKLEMGYVIITVSPENRPSVRVCQKLNGTYLETVNVPQWHPLFRNNEKVKMIYRFDLKEY